MTTRRQFTATALASAAGTLFACTPRASSRGGSEDGEMEVVKCYGVSKCAGHNDCKTANNECKGHSSCKGQGFIKMSRHACEAVGGSINQPTSG